MTSPILFRPHFSRHIEMGFVEWSDLANLGSNDHSIVFQVRDITFPQREIFVHFDLEGRLLNIELRKNGAFPIKILERTFQGLFNVYLSNCRNLDLNADEANYYYDYYQEDVSVDEFLSQELVKQVLMLIDEILKDLTLKGQFISLLQRITSNYSWAGLEHDKMRFHAVYPTPVTVLPPETRPDLNPLFAVLQITQGCWTHACKRGPCAFCTSFQEVKYREKDLQEIRDHIQEVQRFLGEQKKNVRKLFLSDADPLFSKKSIFDILNVVRELWPEVTDFETFISSSAILSKSVSEWRLLKEIGISKLYWGVESADNSTIKVLNKPQTQSSLYQAAKKLDDSNMDYVVIIMSGVGLLVHEKSTDHVNCTSDFVSKIGAFGVDVSKFVSREGTKIYKQIQNKQLRSPTKEEIECEHRLLIQNILKKKPKCTIRGSYGRQFV